MLATEQYPIWTVFYGPWLKVLLASVATAPPAAQQVIARIICTNQIAYYVNRPPPGKYWTGNRTKTIGRLIENRAPPRTQELRPRNYQAEI